MEEERLESAPQEPQEEYTPRPRWQVWAARIALVLFIGLVLMYYYNIAGGGL